MHSERTAALILLMLCIGYSGCAPSHAGRTVGKGVLQVEGSLGGPMLKNLGPPAPVPNTVIGARYGLYDRLDYFGHVNALPLIMGGFLAFDTGLTWGLVKNEGDWGPNLATSTGFVLFTDFENGARIDPLIDLAGGYTFEWFTLFAGAEMALDMWDSNFVISPYLGGEFDIGKLSLSAALLYFSPAFDTFGSPVQYVSIKDMGAVGILLGLKYRWQL